MQTINISPGWVTQESPLLVKIEGEDEQGRPCQRVANARLGDRGGVLRIGTQRLWLGAYDPADETGDLDAKVEDLLQALRDQQDALNSTHEYVADSLQTVTEEVNEAVLAAADVLGVHVLPTSEGLPTEWGPGLPLQPRNVLYQTNAEGAVEYVWIYTGSQWIPMAFAAEHLLVTGSIVSDLIAANVELVSPLITGGEVRGGILRTVVDAGLRHIFIQADAITGYALGGNKAFELLVDLFNPRLSMYEWSNGVEAVHLRPDLLAMNDKSTGLRFFAVSRNTQTLSHTGTLINSGPVYGGPGGTTRLDLTPGQLTALSDSVDNRFSQVNTTIGENYTFLENEIAKRAIEGNWVSLSSNSGWTDLGFGYRRSGNIVQLSGRVTRDVAITGSYAAFDTLPSAIRPASQKVFAVTCYDPLMAGQVTINTAGQMSVRAGGAGATAFDLDHISYDLA